MPYFSPVDAGRCSVYLRFQSAFQIYFVVFGLSYDCVCILIRGCIACENCSCLTPKHIFLRLILSYLAFKHLYVYKHKNGLIHSSGSPSYIYTWFSVTSFCSLIKIDKDSNTQEQATVTWLPSTNLRSTVICYQFILKSKLCDNAKGKGMWMPLHSLWKTCPRPVLQYNQISHISIRAISTENDCCHDFISLKFHGWTSMFAHSWLMVLYETIGAS